MIRALILISLASSALWAQNVVSEDAIHQAVERHVRAALQRQNKAQDRCEIHARWKGDVVLEEKGPVEIAVKPLTSRPLRGAGLVRVELKVKGQTCRTLTVTVDTRIYRRVLVTSRAVRRGELLGEEVLEQEERDVTLLKDGGGAGVRIRVKNRESGKILHGEVLAAGVVRLGGGEGRDE